MAEQVGIDIAARLDNFRAELAKIPEIGGKEAKALAGQLSREIRQAEQAARRAGGAAKDAAGGYRVLGDAAGKAGQSGAKLAGILDATLGPAAANASRFVNDLFDAVEVGALAGESAGISLATLGTAAATLTAAVGAGYLAWRSYNEESERATLIAGEVEAAQKAIEPLLRDTADATLDLAVATGLITEAQADLERNADRAYRTWSDATTETRDRLNEVREASAAVSTQLVDNSEDFRGTGLAGWFLSQAIDGLTTSSSEYAAEATALQGALDDTVKVLRENVEVTGEVITLEDEAKRKKEALTAALKRQAEAERMVREAQADADRQRAAYSAGLAEDERLILGNVAALDQLHEKIVALDDTQEEAARREAARLQAELEMRVANAEAAGMSTQKYAEDEAAIATWLSGELAKIREKETAEKAKARELELKANAETWTRSAELASQAAGAVGDAFGAMLDRRLTILNRLETYAQESEAFLTEGQKAELEKRIKLQRDAALRTFAIQKGAALAEAAVNTASAVVEALPNIPLSLVVGGLGAAQLIAIGAETPSFHGGAGPDEVNATLLRNEAVLNSRATAQLGEEAIRDMNAGAPAAAAGGDVYLINRYRHRDLDVVMADAYAAGGRFSTRLRNDTQSWPTGWRRG